MQYSKILKNGANRYEYKKFLDKFHSKLNGIIRKKEEEEEVNHPFKYKWNIPWYQWAKMVLFTVILLPIKFIGFAIFFIIPYIVSMITLRGIPVEHNMEPLTGWRKNYMIPLFQILARISWMFIGFVKIKFIGKQAPKSQAPILVVASHSSFLDSVFPVVFGMLSVVGKLESGYSFLGYLLRMTQPILVSRDDPNSRQSTIKEICRRAQLLSTDPNTEWPQMLIFPEGTCTNRSSLIQFKTGAFCPGTPIQPVVLRWANSVDANTWTWEGPSTLLISWFIFTQAFLNVEVEFLPVYYPNEKEKEDPQLYANNVRDVMAKSLKVPVIDYSYQDCRLQHLATKFGLPFYKVIPEMNQIYSRKECLELCSTYQKDRSAKIGDLIESPPRILTSFYSSQYPTNTTAAFLIHLVHYSSNLSQKQKLTESSFILNTCPTQNTFETILNIAYNIPHEYCLDLLEELSASPSSPQYIQELVDLMELVGEPFEMYYKLEVERQKMSRGRQKKD